MSGESVSGETVSGEFGDGTALVDQLSRMISTDGLDDLLAGFNDAGDERQVESWLGSGPALPVKAGSVERAIGRTRLTDMAQTLGSSPDHVAEALARIIPAAVQVMTPGGRHPTGAELDTLDLAAMLSAAGVDVAGLLS